MSQATIYRVGSMKPAEDVTPDLQEFLERFDSYCPAGRTPRTKALFASPNLEQHSRWVIGVSLLHFGDYTKSHAITVNPDTTYIYPISAYEDASARETESYIKRYWAAGMTLTQYLEEHEGINTPSTGEWEILFTEKDIIEVSAINNKKVLENSSESRKEQVMRLLFPKMYRKYIDNYLPQESKEAVSKQAALYMNYVNSI